MEMFENIVRIALVVLAVWHLFRKEWKPVGSLVLVFVLTYLPALLERWLGIRVDPLGKYLYMATLVMTVYLGSSNKFYDKFIWWDRVIHLMTGVLFVNFGIAMTGRISIEPMFGVVFFAFCFSLAGHCIWELLEYAADCLGRADTQRWQAHNPDVNHKPEAAQQPAGLLDTMNDLLAGLIGAVVASGVWYFILR